MQTKKRAKPVKFGKATKEGEKEVEVQTPEPSPAPPISPAASVQPQAPVVAPPQQKETELVDKLSDVPFETDFGVPAAPGAPASSSVASSTAAEPIQQAASAVEQHTPEEILRSDNIQPAPSTFDTSPVTLGQTIPPIGRANEPVPFSPHETVFNTPPDAGEKKKNPFLYFLIIAFVAFLTGIAFMGGIYYAMPNKNFFSMLSIPSIPNVIQPPTPTPMPVAKPMPTVTPAKEVKIADYTVRVLNGSGISGQAAKVKTTLIAEGFTVTSTGNAERNDIEKTQITYKKTVTTETLTKIKTVLKKTYVLDKETELPASAAKESDITITIGKEAAK